MRDFLIRRTLQAVAVMLCISAITFFVLNIVPGDPVRVMLGEMADEATVQQVRHSMGLDRPVLEQFFGWLLGFGNKVKIIGPESVKKAFTDYIDKIREIY